MACRFEVTLPSEDARHVAAAREALDEVDALEAALTVFRETSELVRVNREAAAGPVEVTPGLFALLRLCRDLHAATAGAFDPTSTPLSRGWGFLAREGRQPAPEEIAEARNLVGMEKVELGEAERTVRFTTPGVELNLGAIGKGWALDRVAGSLRARGVSRALLSAGGSSLLGWGNEVWELALRPGGAGFGTLRLRDAALGTSGAGEQHFEQDGRRFGHVLDPRAGWPAEGVWSASVVADEAAVADALATALLVGGPEAAEALCASRPGTMAILVLESRKGQMLLFGRRDGVEIDPAPGVGVVEEV
jgi:thiamine biosynthesis lipoprotein